jgi:hypothetical protein
MKKVLCKVGFYAGLVMEYPDHVAESLLATGFAEPAPPGAVLARDQESADLPPAESPEAPAPPPTRREPAPSTPEAGQDEPPGEVEEWPLKMPPDNYLKLHPKGAKAELARRILGK